MNERTGHQMLPHSEMRLIVCSNSAPDMYLGPGRGERVFASPGGLVPMMTAVLSGTGGDWIFTATSQGGPGAPLPEFPGGDVRLYPVDIPESTAQRYREDYCLKTLIWLFHYLLQTELSVSPMPGSRAAWEAYKAVNQMFADALFRIHGNAPDEVVLVNDLHLLLVPGLFARKARSRNSRLVYFHHVPWCEPEYFGILPAVQREEILKSLLCADIVGFHSGRWAKAFLDCCTRYIAGIHVDGSCLTLGDHMTRLAVSPGTVDPGALARTDAAPQTQEWRRALCQQARRRHVIARVDRLDLWKNHLRGFSAYERLLEESPHLAADLWFCVVATPTRLQTERHLSYRASCEEIVARINRRFGAGSETVSLLYPDGGRSSRHLAVAALGLASVALVNPIWDGLNLVAKEAVLLGAGPQLILSANAGVHDQLGAASLSINPFDEEATSQALSQAIETTGPDAAARAEHARGLLAHESALTWLDTLLSAGTGTNLVPAP